MKNTLNHAKDKSLVLFAGAGISMGMPANMPGWFDLNDQLINALWNRIQGIYTIQDSIRDEFISELTAARNNHRFPPDYQAQIMEDQAGIDYFKSLTSVDSTCFNPSHHYIAHLSHAGVFKAIITTNFDTMTEQALASLDIPYEVFFDQEGFIKLSEKIETGKMIEFLPVIKIHGSATSPESMVDTLKQRLKGRAESLKQVLRHFLENYYFIYSGFSGADLDFDPNYLGIRNAASSSPGFCFNYLPGSSVRNSIQELMQVYGDKSEGFASTAEDLFNDLCSQMNLNLSAFPFDQNSMGQSTVADRLRQWADTIAPMKAANMLAALAESLGIEKASRFMLDKVWKNRQNADYEDESFSRFLHNLGKSYLFNFQSRQQRADSQGIALLSFSTPASTPYEEYAQELSQNFGKGALHHEANVKTPIGLSLFSLMKTFEGMETPFANFPNGFSQEGQPLLDVADIVYYYSFYADLVGEHKKNFEFLFPAINIAVKDFDWMREGLLTARRALLAAKTDQDEIAEADIKRTLELAEQLHDVRMQAEGLLAQGVYQRNKSDMGESLKSLKKARELFIDLLRQPQVILTNIELLKTYRIIIEDRHSEFLEDVNTHAHLILSETENSIEDKMHGFEPSFCFTAGWLHLHAGEEHRPIAIGYFIDSYHLARTFQQHLVADWYKEQFIQYGLWDEISTELQSLLKAQRDESS